MNSVVIVQHPLWHLGASLCDWLILPSLLFGFALSTNRFSVVFENFPRFLFGGYLIMQFFLVLFDRFNNFQYSVGRWRTWDTNLLRQAQVKLSWLTGAYLSFFLWSDSSCLLVFLGMVTIFCCLVCCFYFFVYFLINCDCCCFEESSFCFLLIICLVFVLFFVD